MVDRFYVLGGQTNVDALNAASRSCDFALYINIAAYAWGDEGHETIGLIADHYLTAQARTVLTSLLGPTDPSMAADIATRATWADKYRDSSPQRRIATRQWHFVDQEVDGSVDLAGACFGHLNNPPPSPMPGDPNDCVVDKIAQFGKELSNRATPPAERQLAVQFLLHFIGDIHQPLHASDKRDHGGNDTWVAWNQQKVPSGFHSFWDTAIVKRIAATPQAAAAKILGSVSDTVCQEALSGANSPTAPQSRAKESFSIASTEAYGKLPNAFEGTAIVHPDRRDYSKTETVSYYCLSDAYLSNATNVAATQLATAGIRLAFVLNLILADQPTKC